MSYPRKQSPEAWAQQLNFAGLEREHGLPAGVLLNLVRQESQGNCDAGSRKGAQGLCQFMPATAAGMGVNASDPVSSINGAAKYLEQLSDMFDGDTQKALAAYNWGPGNMRKLVRNHPNDWKDHLPKETKDYIRIVGNGIGRSYAERLAAGETISPEDSSIEEVRRRRELAEAGFSPDMMSGGSILGSLFFLLIKSFLEAKMDKIERPAPAMAPEIVATGEPQAPTPTPVPQAPAATAASVAGVASRVPARA